MGCLRAALFQPFPNNSEKFDNLYSVLLLINLLTFQRSEILNPLPATFTLRRFFFFFFFFFFVSTLSVVDLLSISQLVSMCRPR